MVKKRVKQGVMKVERITYRILVHTLLNSTLRCNICYYSNTLIRTCNPNCTTIYYLATELQVWYGVRRVISYVVRVWLQGGIALQGGIERGEGSLSNSARSWASKQRYKEGDEKGIVLHKYKQNFLHVCTYKYAYLHYWSRYSCT